MIAAFSHEGEAREAILAVKRGRDRRAVRIFAEAMAAAVGPVPPDAAVTWAPTTAARRRQRGFDQAELLARALAARVGLPCRPSLRRTVRSSQAGRSRADRLQAPEFVVTWAVGPVILVDDVVTTGATLTAAARALGEAGVEVLCAVTATSSG